MNLNHYKTLSERLKNAEEKFKVNGYKGAQQGICPVQKYGDYPVLLSAPHSVKQIRNSVLKAHEFYTGAIVECLAQDLKCCAVSKQYLIESSLNDDPNTDDETCAYKTAVSQFLREHDIKLFVDVHGLSSKKDSIIDICIDGGQNVNNMACVFALQNKIEEKFSINACSIDKYFQAFSDNIMSKWVHKSFDIDALELEINGAYRWFESDTCKQSLDLYFALKEWLEDLKL